MSDKVGHHVSLGRSEQGGVSFVATEDLNALTDQCKAALARIAELEIQSRLNLRDWLEKAGALREGARIAWESVTWTVERHYGGLQGLYLLNDETRDRLDLGTCSSLPAQGWRVVS
jgi:hypothetical protein